MITHHCALTMCFKQLFFANFYYISNFIPNFHNIYNNSSNLQLILTIMKGQIGIILATTACMATLVGCSPDEPSIKNDSKQEYADNWKKIIGDIDPDQSWNIAKATRIECKHR